MWRVTPRGQVNIFIASFKIFVFVWANLLVENDRITTQVELQVGTSAFISGSYGEEAVEL